MTSGDASETDLFDANGAVRTDDRLATERFVRAHIGWMLAVARRIAGDTVPEDLSRRWSTLVRRKQTLCQTMTGESVYRSNVLMR